MSAVAAGIAALEQPTPQSYREVMASPDAAKWKMALDNEMSSCESQKVWELVRRDELPKGANVLPCKSVFKIKLDEHGNIAQYKARVTPKGCRQKPGITSSRHTRAPVSIRLCESCSRWWPSGITNLPSSMCRLHS